MALHEHLQDFPTCGNVPHAILNVQLVYCPHDAGFTMSCSLGDTSSVPWSSRVTRYGPFDNSVNLAEDLASYVKVMFRRTLLDASLAIHSSYYDGDDSPETPGT